MLKHLAATAKRSTRASSVALLGVLGLLAAAACAVYATAYSSGTKPPRPSITAKPAKNTAAASARFRFRDSWSGATFQCALDGSRFRRCSSPKRYRGGLAGGWHAFRVRAVAGGDHERSAPATYRWWIDGRPTAPRIVAHPTAPTDSKRARFAFVGRERDLRFQCRLDARAWTSCRSPVRYAQLALGRHVFRARAKDPDGPMSATTRFAWRIGKEATSAESVVRGPDFAITLTQGAGGLGVTGRTALYPGGPAGMLALTFDNPSGDTIYVTALNVAVTNTPAGCDRTADFRVIQSNVSESNAVAIPPHGSATLPTQGVSAPRLMLVDRPVNQDACQNARIGFAFEASAHS
jgi:hypothetical protein